MPMTDIQLKAQQNAIRQYQALYDDVLRTVGRRAPEPTLGQRCDDYRREALRMMKQTYLPRNHELFRVQMRALPDDALNVIEPQVLAAVPIEANNPIHVPFGELKKIEEVDPYGQVKQIKFIGQQSFVAQMGRPGRRVVSFNTPNGPMSASGGYLRR
jgi:hypothetical protein